MNYFILLLVLCCLSVSPIYALSFVPSSSAMPILEEGRGEMETGKGVKKKKVASAKKKKKKARQRPPLFNTTELNFIKWAVYLSVVVALSVLLMVSLEIFIVMIPFIAFLWFLSGLFATMSIILLLARAQNNHREINESIGWHLILFIFTRIGFIVAMFFLLGAFAGTLLVVTFIPSFIIYIVSLLLLFSTNKTKPSASKMFTKHKE